MSSPWEPNMMTRKFNQLLVSLGVTITLLTNAYPQASRTVMVQSNSGVLLFPTNLFTANAPSARSGLSLATHATNPIVPVTSGGSGATNAATARTNLGLVWSGLTNSNAADFRSALGVPLAALTNTNNATFLTAIGLGLANSPSLAGLTLTNGTNILTLSATASESRTNFGLVWSGLTNSNAADFRSALGVPLAALTNTNNTNFRSDIGLPLAALTNTNNANFRSDIGLPLAALTNTDSANFRSSIGLGWSALTNTNATNFRTAIGLGATNDVTFGAATVYSNLSLPIISGLQTGWLGVAASGFVTNNVPPFGVLSVPGYLDGLGGFTNFTMGVLRTNLGLGWSALTNSNAGTGLVSVNTNGEVVSPTNFWQVARIEASVQSYTGILATQTNNATNARNLYVYSLATNVSGISNTILLPTNAATFAGDEVTVIHKGTTNTITVVRQAGSTNNLITLNRFDEAVKFIRESGQWAVYYNISFVEPIQFSGTNATALAAASRTNLGLGITNSVSFQNISLEGGQLNFSNGAIYWLGDVRYEPETQSFQGTVQIDNGSISLVGSNAASNIATTRTNLGLPLPALTNTSNVTMMRALSGSTNTNHPFSGTVSVVGTNNTNTLTFSNGILQSVQ